MSTINFAAFGQYSSIQSANAFKAQVITSTNTWSITSQKTLGVASTVDQVCRDVDGNYYVAINSTLWRYNSSFVSDTAWGTDATVVITQLLVPPGGHKIAANAYGELFVAAGQLATGVNPIDAYAISSTGKIQWSKAIITQTDSPLVVAVRNSNNPIFGAAHATALGVQEYQRITGTLLKTYPALSMENQFGLCTNSINDIFVSGAVLVGSPAVTIGRADFFASAATTPTWSIVSDRWMNVTTINSAYVFLICVNSTDAGNSAFYRVYNNSTGVLTADVAISIYSDPSICLTTVPDTVVVANNNTFRVFDAAGTALASVAGTSPFITNLSIMLAGPVPAFSVSSLSDQVYSKYLLAFTNNRVYWDSVSSVMAEITSARDQIDTGVPMSVVVGMQKVFVANVSTLGVLDFGNVRVATTNIGTAAVSIPLKGTVLTGDASGAKMITDYCTAATASAYVYGYKTTAASFLSGEVVTGGALTTISFTLIATASAQVTGPHYYSWQSMFNDTVTYGELPEQASLACLYNGRTVLSGSAQYPHQWYMSRVLDPFNWLYVVNDPLSAVRGGNAEAAQIGDVVKALIPYQDDYLIFGCANSIWLLHGDPASGGALQPVTESTGIFGPKAWCFDDKGNLYFFGLKGLYRLRPNAPETVDMIECLSEFAIPKLVPDWNLDDSKDRITLTFDTFRNGIIISKTILANGSNENVWYDLTTKGFYPEIYPEDCGIFCSHYYQAITPNYQKLLFGCADGYIRRFDSDEKNDTNSVNTAVAIDSYMVCPTIAIGGDPSQTAKVKSVTVINAGGAISGSFGDTDAINLKFHVGDSAEEVLEDIQDDAEAMLSISLISAGRQTKIGMNLRGSYLGIQVFNAAAGESWGLERMFGDAMAGGRVK